MLISFCSWVIFPLLSLGFYDSVVIYKKKMQWMNHLQSPRPVRYSISHCFSLKTRVNACSTGDNGVSLALGERNQWGKFH